MKHIKLDTYQEITYPVGNSMKNTISVIDNMTSKIIDLLKMEYHHKNDINLIGRGSSGAIISGIISLKLIELNFNVNIIHIKKDGEKSHGGIISNEIYLNDGVNIIVDDFISTGTTMRIIVEKISKYLTKKIDCVCVSGPILGDIKKFFKKEKVKYIICSRVN